MFSQSSNDCTPLPLCYYRVIRRDDSGDRGDRLRLVREDRGLYGPRHWASPNRGELSDVSEELATSGAPLVTRDFTRGRRQRVQHQEDPYYHGLSARVTAFPISHQEKETNDYSKSR